MKLKKEGIILLNGQEVQLNRLAFKPMSPIKLEAKIICLIPPQFPSAVHIFVSDSTYSRELIISRIPNNSIHIAKYESSRDDSLRIQFSFDKKENTLSLRLSVLASHAKSIEELIASASIFNSFLDGKGCVSGYQLDGLKKSNKANYYDKTSIAFWKKVLEIEQITGKHFTVPKGSVDFETAVLVEQLYQNLVFGQPVRSSKIITKIDLQSTSKEKDAEIDKQIGQPIFFEYEATENIKLFGAEISLPAIVGIFNCIIADYSTKDGKSTILLSSEAEDKKMIVSSICFETEDDLLRFKKKWGDAVEQLHNAKHPYEYIQEAQSLDKD